MAKFNMKDYEMAMLEEERQDRLQEELENRREKESWEAEANWWDYQRKQEEERLREEFNRYPEYDGYFDEDDFDDDDCYPNGEYDPDCNSDPDEFQDSEDAELSDPWYDHIYDYGFQKYDCFDEYDLLDAGIMEYEDDFNSDADGCYLYPKCNLCSCYWCHDYIANELYFENRDEEEQDFEELRRIRKAVARSRHHASEKAKKRAEKSAKILETKYNKASNTTDDTFLRLSSRFNVASKIYSKVSKKDIVSNIFKLIKEKGYTSFATNMVLVKSFLNNKPLPTADYFSILEECESYLKNDLINQMLKSVEIKRFHNFDEKLSFARSFLTKEGFPSFELDCTLAKFVKMEIA